MNRCHFLGKLIGNPELFEDYNSDVVNFKLEVEEYRKVAADWCNKFSKIPIKGKLKCGRCCDASYFCK